MGWAGIKNGKLLALAQAQFDVFVTVDRNLSFQQHVPQFSLGVLVLTAPSNRLADLLPLVPILDIALAKATPGTVISLSSSDASGL
jgi:hypothetical protein